MKVYNKYRKIIELIVVFAVITIITFTLKYYLRPILYMMIVFFVCNPLYKLLMRVGLPRKLISVLLIIFINILLILLIIVIGNNLYNFLQSIYNDFDYIEEAINKIIVYFKKNSNISLVNKIYEFINSTSVKNSAINTGSQVFAYFIGNILAFFLLIDKEEIYDAIVRIIPEDLLTEIIIKSRFIRKMAIIEMELVTLSTIETILGFFILGVKNPVTLGLFSGIFDILPYVGRGIVFIPIIIYNIIVKNYFRVFGLICLYALVQISREILEAKLLSNKFNIHPLLILISVYIGMKLFGMIGIFVGPIYGILAKEIVYNNSDI
ncbi:AI-2E family transporter [Clostridium sp. MSJ-8]|uniref:AI-2E family transporter n=1 Tax=Clostridium sp. MSJ-8 TaxID=2841510 RepID=UPI001C0F0361|nr:AI-2E family transporter [Clostridium sp. MSJ-8]MBU5488676.1 AI-2E family transporter [Clostridium sp. MSJ-8]